MQIRQSEFFISSVVQYAIHVSISTPLGKFVTNAQFSKFEKKKNKDQFPNWRESTYISVRMYKYSHQLQATCSNGQTNERVTINIINRKWLDTLFSNADLRTQSILKCSGQSVTESKSSFKKKETTSLSTTVMGESREKLWWCLQK